MQHSCLSRYVPTSLQTWSLGLGELQGSGLLGVEEVEKEWFCAVDLPLLCLLSHSARLWDCSSCCQMLCSSMEMHTGRVPGGHLVYLWSEKGDPGLGTGSWVAMAPPDLGRVQWDNLGRGDARGRAVCLSNGSQGQSN